MSHYHPIKRLIFLLLFVVCCCQQAIAQDLSDIIKAAVSNIELANDSIEVEFEPLSEISDTLELSEEDSIESSLSPIQNFYKKRNHQAAWYSEFNLLLKADTLLKIISKSGDEGLNPEFYGYSELKSLYETLNNVYLEMYLADPTALTYLDIELTNAALEYASDLRLGRINPDLLPFQWEISRDEFDAPEFLNQAVKASNLFEAFEELKPQNAHYLRLKGQLNNLAEVAKIDTGTIFIEPQQKIELGDTGEQVVLLKERLNFYYGLESDSLPNRAVKLFHPVSYAADSIQIDSIRERRFEFTVCSDTLYLEEDKIRVITDSSQYSFDTAFVKIDTFLIERDSFIVESSMVYDPAYFDSTTLALVKSFQSDYGLKPDGIVGPNTISKLNAPASSHLEKVILNMERWRWVPRNIEGQYIIVNVAGYYLDVFEKDTIQLTKQVMVGNPRTKTPIFSDRIQYIELNPYWTVPYSISSREILPRIKKDPGYLARNNYKLLVGGKAINPYSVDWTEVSRSKFPYTIRQDPGAGNALGEVKFMFPNRYNVYLHDTQSKDKFVEPIRAFSHGCIRLETPFELASFLFKDDPKWSGDKIYETKKKGKNKRITLKESVPIYLVYLTAYVGNDEKLNLQLDVYDRDSALQELWNKRSAKNVRSKKS